MSLRAAGAGLVLVAAMLLQAYPSAAGFDEEGFVDFVATDAVFTGFAECESSPCRGALVVGADVFTLDCLEFVDAIDGSETMFASYEAGAQTIHLQIGSLKAGASEVLYGFSRTLTSSRLCGAGGIRPLGHAIGFRHEHVPPADLRAAGPPLIKWR